MQPTIPGLASIVINNYNYEKYVGRAIESALSQEFKNLEIIVIDDGSTDNSASIIESYSSRIIYQIKENGGQGSALNAGIELASGEYIFLLDADDYFLPKKVSKIVAIYQSNPDIEWVYHSLLKVSEHSGGNIFSSKTNNSGQKTNERPNIIKYGISRTPRPATSGLTFRRSCAERIFPIPTPENAGIYLSDRYISLLGQFLATGMFVDEKLAVLWIHSENRYSGRRKRWSTAAVRDLTTAVWAAKFDNRLAILASRDIARSLAVNSLTHCLPNDIRAESLEVLKSTPPKAKLSAAALYLTTLVKTAINIGLATVLGWTR